MRLAQPVPVYILPEGQNSGSGGGPNTLWISDLLGSAVRAKWIILSLVLAGGTCGYLVGRKQPKMYQARTQVEVQSLNENFLSLRELSPTAAPGGYDFDIQTQAKILRGQTLIKRTVDKLAQDSMWSGPYAREALATTAQSFKVVVSERSRILEISADASDPNLAADFVNTSAQEFIELGLEGRINTSQRTTEWMTVQLRDLKKRLEASEEQLQTYAGSHLVVTPDKGNLLEEKLRQVQHDLAQAEGDLIAKQSRLQVARTSAPESLPSVLDSGILRDYQSKLTDRRRQLAELSSQYTPAYYKVERVQAQITDLEAAFLKERANTLGRLRNEYEEASERTKLLTAAYQGQARAVSDEAARLVHYEMLKHEVDTNRQLYEGLLQKVKEAGLASGLRASNVRIVEPAEPPTTPYRPRPTYTAAAGAFGGLALGLCFAQLGRRSERRRIQNPGDAAKLLELPELGVIYSNKLATAAEGRSPQLRELVASVPLLGPRAETHSLTGPRPARPLSLQDESFRGTVTSILFSHLRCRVIVLASPEPMAGKTTIATHLGRTFAALGQRVLLVDADLRKPALHKAFGVSNDIGLTDLLGENEGVSPGALPLETSAGVHLLPAGRGLTVAGLYGSRMTELMLRFRREFDMVLVDTPAMLHIPDARVLGRLADGVILVVRSNATDREAVLNVRQRLTHDGIPLLGTILNDWKPASDYDYYHPTEFYKHYRTST